MKIVYTNKEKFDADLLAQKIIPKIEKFFGNRENCLLYHNSPTYFPENSFIPSLCLIDREFGIFIFKAYPFIDSDKSEDIRSRLEKDVPLLEDYLHVLGGSIKRPKHGLRDKIKISSFLAFPFLRKDGLKDVTCPEGSDFVYEDSEIFSQDMQKIELNDLQWRTLISIIQKVETISKNISVQVEDLPKTMSQAIVKNEQGISVFDDRQETAATLIPNGGMRIRGIAGTGKTIVMAWKAAYLHAHYPQADILYTFGTKSLYNHIKNLISIFYRRYSQNPINWEKLHVYHAWGGARMTGVYYNACIKNDLPVETMQGLRLMVNPFGKVCSNILDKNLSEEYDYVLIDEAQDMPIEFFRLVEKLTRQPKIVIIAYDELQSTDDVKMPNFEELFGFKKDKSPIITLDEEYDIILKKSYRNHMKVLHTALAFGFGIYNKNSIIQILDKEENWESVGYNLLTGSLEPGKHVELERPMENSPNRIDRIYQNEELISLNTFNTKEEELDFVAEKISNLVKEQGVRYDEIMVVNIDAKNVKEEFDLLRTKLVFKEIPSKVPGFSDDSDEFFVPGFVTLSTVRRARGNECPIVFVIGMNKISESRDKVSARIRRSFAFVSITRSKGWCYLTASGSASKELKEEYERIIKDYPKLKFVFPSNKELDEIRKIDYIAKDEKKRTEYYERISTLKEILKSKDAYIPEELKKQFRDFLNK